GIAQCLQAQGDELADAVAEEDLVGAEVVDPAGLVVLDDRAAGGEDSPRIRISLRHRQVLDHVLDDRVRGFGAEGGGVADVELEDRVPGGLHGLGLFEDGASDVVEDIGQLRRLPEHVNRGTFLPLTSDLTLCRPPRRLRATRGSFHEPLTRPWLESVCYGDLLEMIKKRSPRLTT